jgi:hypothetical protein
MSNFAIIVGIDNYANPEWNLTAAVADALKFLEWAHGPGGVPADETHTRLLLSSAKPDVTTLPHLPAISENIIRAIADFQDGAGEGGDRLYVYYAGHGVSHPGTTRGGPAEPLIIPADVQSLRFNVGLLIPFSAIITALSTASPTEHFFFIDACRDFALEEFTSTIGPSSIRWQPPLSEGGQSAAQYVLYATSPGQKAYEAGRGAFGRTLVAGLNGEGRAKAWLRQPPRYEVGFDNLVKFIQQRVRDEIKRMAQDNADRYVQVPQVDILGAAKGTNPILRSIDPPDVENVSIGVRVTPRSAREKARVRVIQIGPGGKEVEYAIQPPPALTLPARFELAPADYIFMADADQYQAQREICEAYESTIVEFPLEPVPPAVAAGAPRPVQEAAAAAGGMVMIGAAEGELILVDPASVEPTGALVVSSEDPAVAIVVRDSQLQIVEGGMGKGSLRLESLVPGIYRVQPVVPDGTIAEQTVEVQAGKTTEVPLNFAFKRLQVGTEQEQMLNNLGISSTAQGYISPSKHLAPIADAKLASLLGFAAFAAHWPGDEFHRLRNFGVTPMRNVPPGEAGLLVLIGAAGDRPLPDMDHALFLAAGHMVARTISDEVIDEGGFEPLAGFAAAGQRVTRIPVGPLKLELQLPELASTHYALIGLPDRVTVLVLVAEDGGGFDVQQYLIPLRPPDDPAHAFLLSDPSNIRRLELAQRFYGTGLEIPINDTDLELLLLGKWLDPLLGCVAGYSLIRRGMTERYIGEPPYPGADAMQPAPSAMLNMLKFFGDVPDSHVLAGLAEPERRKEHYANALQRGLPLFADGFRTLYAWYQDQDGELPPILADAGGGLLPSSVWTAWTVIRPALLLRGGNFGPPVPGLAFLEQAREDIERTSRSVGRIEVVGHPHMEYVGTGFLAAPAVLMTANFVVEQFAQKAADGRWVFQDGMRARVDLAEEFGGSEGSETSEFDIVDVVGVDEVHRVALLRMAPTSRNGSSLPDPLTLAAQAPQPLERRKVYVIGYPALDPRRSDMVVMMRVFSGVFNVKRLLPGEIIDVAAETAEFHHDCFTLGGNAGSCVVDVETSRILGLHIGGRSHEKGHVKYNTAVALWMLREHPLLKQVGARFV